jgi:hypothetical protein
MGRLLDPVRRKINQAVIAAAQDMQATMDYQLEYAMLYHPWKWKGMVEDEARKGYPYSNSGGNGSNGDLFKSKKLSDVIKLKTATGTTYAFSFTWNPVHESGRHYAALVHDGSSKPVEYQMYYPDEDPGPRESYSARPWTAWVTPSDQRGKMRINHEFVQPVDVPDIGWQFAKQAFVQALRSRLNGTTVRISL